MIHDGQPEFVQLFQPLLEILVTIEVTIVEFHVRSLLLGHIAEDGLNFVRLIVPESPNLATSGHHFLKLSHRSVHQQPRFEQLKFDSYKNCFNNQQKPG
jgi:hypothetical protein